ncbi:heavy metal translocating P-type ATPase [Butyrivibrio sp. INlla16]|uniref:heavy metal translocating P-type ATPase n=1 Tax=Butyrivibrio sp. INlla16 TaxID=1520807 RepID=UPI00088D1EF8|nr:heavy metal translocating P-type ATPase [Butyrivibrio sp. INlla16]SDB17383.1 Cd2+/Zn2+-exporting ATPase [Butyrivibrio sp. INlla16]
MTKKMKKTRNRIIGVLIAFIVLLIAEHMGAFEAFPWYVSFVIFLIPYLVIGYDVLRKAFINISHGQVFDENFLMMIATFGAFAISEYTEALAVMLFYQIGELFQSYAVGKSRASITELMSIAPEYANVIQDDGEAVETDPEEVGIGTMLLIKPGEKIPIDGVVTEGESFVDTSAITGESVPRRVSEGEEVISGCVNKDSVLKIRTTKNYEDSTVSKILELVENASNKKSRMENFITRFAKYYTPVVTIGAVLLAVIPPLLGIMPFSDSIKRACIFLIVSCPCALVISVPLGFFGGIGASSKMGILVKGSNYLEAIAEASTLVLDKTGTITKGEFKVSEIIPAANLSKEEIVCLAAGAEKFSNHPIARSVIEYHDEIHKNNSSLTDDKTELTDIKEVPGHGITAKLGAEDIYVGNAKLLKSNNIEFKESDLPGTIIYVAKGKLFVGTIIISDTIKEGAAESISKAKRAGVSQVIMLTGDNEDTAKVVADKVGIDKVFAQLLPADKVERVESLLDENKNGKVAFVGDGINDAPVLMRADVGIAMGSMGSDAAIEAADIVLMDDDIGKISAVIQIARKTLRIVKENIVFALFVKILILFLGALGFATMWMAVFGDVGVAVLAILNSMRAMKWTKEDMNGKVRA